MEVVLHDHAGSRNTFDCPFTSLLPLILLLHWPNAWGMEANASTQNASNRNVHLTSLSVEAVTAPPCSTHFIYHKLLFVVEIGNIYILKGPFEGR